MAKKGKSSNPSLADTVPAGLGGINRAVTMGADSGGARRVCRTCDFWQATPNPVDEKGRCRVVHPSPSFPITLAGDWCGEWRGY